jgi:hypothetical protein
MNAQRCDHPNISILASVPVMLLHEQGHLSRVIVGDLFQRGRILLS